MDNNKKLLLIEDDKFLAELLGDQFRKAGISYDLALDGEDGLLKARASSYDLILLDLILPGIDGYEVLRQLKADTELKKIPVLILSNLSQKDEIERGIRLGAEDFLIKSNFDIGEITRRIKKILEKTSN